MAEHGDIADWPVEPIPDADELYMGLHKRWLYPDGALMLGAIRDHDGGMSTDWSKYSTPQETRDRRRTPADNAVISLHVGSVRAMPGQTVTHSPLPENRAHTDVMGQKKDEEARMRFVRIARFVLAID